MPYRKFLPWNIAAGILWGAGSSLLGYFAGENFEAVAHAVGWGGLTLLALAIVVFAGVRFFAGRKKVKR